MNTGFSSLVCPGWDLLKIAETAAELKFDGIELRGLGGELDLRAQPALAKSPEQVRTQLESLGVELVCLASSVTLDSKDASKLANAKTDLVDHMELASSLGCPYVRLFAGEIQRWDKHDLALSRIAEALDSLVPAASRTGVTLVVENSGDFASSADMWFLADAVDHPLVRICWNQCTARTVPELPTNSIPRLGKKSAMVHVCDATFDEQATLTGYVPLGQGDLEVAHQIDLLKGLAYRGYVVFEWPKMWVASLPAPEIVLPDVASFLRECIDAKQAILSAYKGDKNPTKFVAAN